MNKTEVTRASKIFNKVWVNGEMSQLKNKLEEEDLVFDDKSYCLESDMEISVEENNFHEEVEETLEKLQHNIEAIAGVGLEVMNLKLAENKSFDEATRAVYQCVLNKHFKIDQNDILGSLRYLTKFSPLIKKFIHEKKEMNSVIEITEEFCKKLKDIKFHLITQLLFKEEILNEDVILDWFELKKNSENKDDKENVRLMEKFVEWLKEEEEESEDDEESEDEDN